MNWKQQSIVLGEPVFVLKETDVCKEMIHLHHTVTNKRELQSVSNCIFHFDVSCKQQSIVLGEPVLLLKETDVCMKKYDTLTSCVE